MGYTPSQERALATATIGEDALRAAIIVAVDEEFGGTYGGESIVGRVVELLRPPHLDRNSYDLRLPQNHGGKVVMTREELNAWLGEQAMELCTDADFDRLTDELVERGFPVSG